MSSGIHQGFGLLSAMAGGFLISWVNDQTGSILLTGLSALFIATCVMGTCGNDEG